MSIRQNNLVKNIRILGILVGPDGLWCHHLSPLCYGPAEKCSQYLVSQVSSLLSPTVLNAMAVEDYQKNHWPNLEKAIDRLLIQHPKDHISVSYAQIYR